jgi:hypothetical protein
VLRIPNRAIGGAGAIGNKVSQMYSQQQEQEAAEVFATILGIAAGVAGGIGGVHVPHQTYQQPANRQPTALAPRPVVQAPRPVVEAPHPIVQTAPQAHPGTPATAYPQGVAPQPTAQGPVVHTVPQAAQSQQVHPQLPQGCNTYGSTNLSCYQAGYLTLEQYQANVKAGVP